jgi:hypothetical protein
VQITSALPVAKMVGANRVVIGNGIVQVVGDAAALPDEERKLRRRLVENALATLRSKD